MIPSLPRLSRTPAGDVARSLADPFNYSACIPDAAIGAGCFSAKQELALTTGTANTCTGLIVSTDPESAYLLDTGSLFNTPVVPSTWSSVSSISVIQSLYKSWRPVSVGIRLSYVGNTQTDGGILLLGTVAAGTAPKTTFDAQILSGCVVPLRDYKLVPLRNGGVVTWRPDSLDDMVQYARTNTGGADSATSTSVTSVQRPYLIAYVYGAAVNTTCLQAEVVWNWEGQIANQSIQGGGTSALSRTPAQPGWFETAMGMVSNIEHLMPYVGPAIEGYQRGGIFGAASSTLRQMANGVAYPMEIPQSGKKLIAAS